jgi:threonine dehydrogenase-like Zn-dependent dehydrogenase
MRPYTMMRTAVLSGPGRIQFRKVPVPKPGPTQVRVRLEGCGVCGSNLHPWEGRPWFNYPFEAGAPGHEGWGEVDAIGAEVGNCKVGDRVAVLSYHAFAEFDVAEEECVVRLPNLLKKKPFPGEALGCAMNVFRRSEITAGQTVAVIGVGFLGALITSLASKAGARVIAISRRSFALSIAKEMGAGETVRMDEHAKIINRVRDLTDGTLCDCVVEAVGAQWPLDLAGELTRERGRLVIAGYHQDGPRQVNMQLWNWRGLDVINAHERDPNVYIRGVQAAVKAVSCGQLDPSPLYTHAFEFHQIGEAFRTMQKRPDHFLKALVKL